MRALVVGADGFVGRWLLRHLVDAGDEVTAAVGPGYAGTRLPAGLEPHRVDVRDAGDLAVLASTQRPDTIYYLAGISRADHRDDLQGALGVSVHGALHVLAAAADAPHGPVRLLHVGSSHMYGAPADGRPIDEATPLRPTSVYGAAKAAAEAALLRLGPAAGVTVIAVRAFNHIGPGQAAGFVLPSIARQVASIRRGEQEPIIHVGGIALERDFTDVRDVVRAYRLLALHGEPGAAYNVASGSVISVAELVERIKMIANVEADIRAEPDLLRRGEPRRIVGDAGKLRRTTGWMPRHSIEATIADVLDEW